MKIALIKCSLGTFIGEKLNGVSWHQLTNPAMVDFISVPGQSKFGQPQIAVLRNVTLWPADRADFNQIDQAIISNYDSETDKDNGLVKLYLQVVKEKKTHGAYKII